MNDAELRDTLNKLGTLMTGKDPQGAPPTMSIERFMYGEIFYCSHDGGYTRFRFDLADELTAENAGTLKWIWNGSYMDPGYQDRMDRWESPAAERFRNKIEMDLAWAARFFNEGCLVEGARQ